MAILPIGTSPAQVVPFPFLMEPLNQITPFSYRDGMTYAKMLEGLRKYLNDFIVPTFNDKLDEIFAEFQKGIANAELVFTDGIESANNTVIQTKAEWQLLFDNFMLFVQDKIAEGVLVSLDTGIAAKNLQNMGITR